ncbi:MAG TPA: Uma2 family endonuclease [Nakamurella sp.]|nr:Uma2 family endonuclease [Nakamurella sp.]
MASMAAPVETGRWPDHVSGEWTVESLETLPDNGLRYEILDGTLLVTPSPTPRHQGAIVELAVLLRAACPADHRVFVAPLDWQPDGRTSLEPDLLVVRRDRIGEKNIPQPAALVVEVLSPGTARIDRMIKFSRYAEGGIGQCWIVDPRVPSVQVYDLVDGAYTLIAEGTGDTPVSVVEPVAVTVVPQLLVDG